MFCSECGARLNEGASVCAQCGAGAEQPAEELLFETRGASANPTREGTAVASMIIKATVYTDAAEITRTAKVQCEAGSNVFRLTPLSRSVRSDSLTVTAAGAAVVSAEYIIDPLADASSAKERDGLLAQYKKACDDIEKTRDEIAVLGGEYEVLMSGCTSHGEDARSAESIGEMTALFSKEGARIKDAIRGLKRLLSEVEREKKRLADALSGQTELASSAGVITVELFCEKAGEAELEVKYTDESARWRPLYDIRTEGAGSKCRLTLKGEISQSTGEDWTDLPLTLATGAAVSGGVCPELYPERLGVYTPPKPGARGLAMKAMAFDAVEEASCADSEEGFAMLNFAQARAVSTALNVEYALGASYSVKTGGDVKADILSGELEAEYTYKSAPKLRETVYLTARARDWRELAPLAGEAAVFVGGAYVGSAFITPEADEDELSLSLGSCSDIDINRSAEKRFTHKADLLGKARYEVEWTITARSRRGGAVSLEVIDQIPVSADAQIEINALELSGAALDAETGELKWAFELKANESRELKVKYSVSYPKKITPTRV